MVKEFVIAQHHVLLGVSGSIAAFKSAQLASLLVKSGYAVQVIMTPGATRFITPLTFEAITGQPVMTSVWEEQPGSTRMGHIELARWGSILVVAPASASVLARLALGLANDALDTTALTFDGPLVIAPAMETHMFRHPATQDHLRLLRERGAEIVGPVSGRLASGASGEGRMVEPEEIAATIERRLTRSQDLAGTRILVTTGPTYEPVDPVRFLGNRSSGKMGFALAEAARDRGAHVTLISGPVALTPPGGVTFIPVERTEEMRDAVLRRAAEQQVIIMAAAIADFRPVRAAEAKLKRAGNLNLELEATPDISAELAGAAPGALRVGFALETENLIDSARGKLRRKGQHLVVANLLSPEHNPFGAETNRVALVSEREVIELSERSKREVAEAILDQVKELLAHQDEPGGD